MSSLSPKDRVSLCLFSYEDGRRCRTPRISSHPHFCFYHAQKESRAQVAESLAKDLDYFFSGDYLSACDLSSALSLLIPATIRGAIKPRLARTVAYMFQTQLQAIHLSQREYANAFGTEGWRKAVRSSITSNHAHLFPPDPDAPEAGPQQPAPPSPPQPTPQASDGAGQARPNAATQSTADARPTPTQAEAALSVARRLFPARRNATPTQPAGGSPTTPPTPTTQPTASANQPTTPTVQPDNPTPPAPPCPQHRRANPHHDPYAVHFDHNYRLRESPKVF